MANNQLKNNQIIVRDQDFENLVAVPESKLTPVTHDAFSVMINSNELYETMTRERRLKYANFFKKLLNDQARFGKEFFHLINNSYGQNKKIFRGQYTFSEFDPRNLEHLEIHWKAEIGPECGRLHFHLYIEVATKNFIKGQSLGVNVKKMNDLFKVCFSHLFRIKSKVTRNPGLAMKMYTDKDQRALAKRQELTLQAQIASPKPPGLSFKISPPATTDPNKDPD